MGFVVIPRMSYNIQMPFRGNTFLLEESEAGEIRDLIRQGKSWWSQWFSKIRELRGKDVDKKRVTWIRCLGIPCHAWNSLFF